MFQTNWQIMNYPSNQDWWLKMNGYSCNGHFPFTAGFPSLAAHCSNLNCARCSFLVSADQVQPGLQWQVVTAPPSPHTAADVTGCGGRFAQRACPRTVAVCNAGFEIPMLGRADLLWHFDKGDVCCARQLFNSRSLHQKHSHWRSQTFIHQIE